MSNVVRRRSCPAVVDDTGAVHVNWDCASTLGLVPGEDTWVVESE